jgi:hypothetical protein
MIISMGSSRLGLCPDRVGSETQPTLYRVGSETQPTLYRVGSETQPTSWVGSETQPTLVIGLRYGVTVTTARL